MKMLLSKDSIQTMTWMTYGSELHKYLGSELPKEYGGTGGPLTEHAITPKYSAGEEKDAAPSAPSEDVSVKPAAETAGQPAGAASPGAAP